MLTGRLTEINKNDGPVNLRDGLFTAGRRAGRGLYLPPVTQALLPPSLEDLERLAQAAWLALPESFRTLAGDIVIHIEEFADEETLADLGMDDPFALTGLYSGVDLTRQSIMDPTPQAPMVLLYRRAILEEWIDRGDVALDELVAHVLVHEVGHHFGLSDAQMDALLEEAD